MRHLDAFVELNYASQQLLAYACLEVFHIRNHDFRMSTHGSTGLPHPYHRETASSSQPNAKDKTQGATQLPIATPESVARKLPNFPSTFSSHLPARDFDFPPASVPALCAKEHSVSPGPSACVTSGQGRTTMSVRFGFGASIDQAI